MGNASTPSTPSPPSTLSRSSAVVSSPTAVLDVDARSSLVSLSAGSTHSAIATSDGSVYTFGRGADGALGTGMLDPVFEASRVEHLVGHHRVRWVAAGRRCTWYVNDEGVLLGSGAFSVVPEGWGAEEGGGWYHGTGFEDHGRDEDGFLEGNEGEEGEEGEIFGLAMGTMGSIGSMGTSATTTSAIPMDAYGNYMREGLVGGRNRGRRDPHPPAASTSYPQHFIPFIDHRARSIELQQSKYMFSEQLRSMSETDSAQRVWDDLSELSRFSESAALPAMVSLLGGSGLLGHVVAGVGGGDVGGMTLSLSQNAQQPDRHGQSTSLIISSLYACPHTSRTLALTAGGLPVLVLPLKTTRALPLDASSMPASWAQSSLPPPVVLRAVKDNGGGVKGVVGEDWFGVLCRDGRVVVWWMDDEAEKPEKRKNTSRSKIRTTRKGDSVFYTQDGTTVATLDFGTHVRDVSASLDALYVCDGRRVWSCPMIPGTTRNVRGSRCSGTDRIEAIAHATATMLAPKILVDVGPDALVQKLDVNSRGTVAAVTDSGNLWILGDVISGKELRQLTDGGQRPRRTWEGLRGGSGRAVVVPGLHGVTDVSLGEHHALAVVV